MNTLTDATKEHLACIARERGKLEKRAAAYERNGFEEIFESLNPLATQAACEALSDVSPEEVGEVSKALANESLLLDAINERFDAVESTIETSISNLTERREEIITEHNNKRKALNRSNMSKGFWPLYGGIFFCVIAVFATRDFGFGMVGAIVSGIVGYFAGSYIFKVLASRFVRTDPAIQEKAGEELEALRKEHENIATQLNTLKGHLDQMERDEEAIDELQMHIQDTLDDCEVGEGEYSEDKNN